MAGVRKQRQQTAFLSRQDWLDAAVKLLIEEGIDQVKVQRLGKALRTSRGSFYWHFRDRDELLDEILRHWQATNTDQLIAALGPPERPLEDRILGLFGRWVGSGYPRFDNAIRAWASRSPKVRRVQRAAEQRRRQQIAQLFLDAGYPPAEAAVRGDVLYFTQVGYFLLDLGESEEERLARLEPYYLAFTGRPLSRGAADRFRAGRSIAPRKSRAKRRA